MDSGEIKHPRILLEHWHRSPGYPSTCSVRQAPKISSSHHALDVSDLRRSIHAHLRVWQMHGPCRRWLHIEQKTIAIARPESARSAQNHPPLPRQQSLPQQTLHRRSRRSEENTSELQSLMRTSYAV